MQKVKVRIYKKSAQFKGHETVRTEMYVRLMNLCEMKYVLMSVLRKPDKTLCQGQQKQ